MVNLFKNRLFQILCLASCLRFIFLGSIPLSLNWDEVSMGYTAYTVSHTGMDEWGVKLPIFFRSYGEWKSAVYIYLLVPLVKLFGMQTAIIRLPSALFGVISVYLMYLIGKKLLNHQVGLWAAFLMAVTPWSFFLSRPAFEGNVALTLLLAGLYCFLTQRYLFSAILFGLAPHTYNSAKLVVPLLVIYLIWSSKLYKQWKQCLLFVSILALFAAPILSNLLSGHAQARYTQVGITTNQEAIAKFYALRTSLPLKAPFPKLIINQASFFAYTLFDNFWGYLSPGYLMWHGGDHTQQSLPYHGVLYISEFCLVIIGIIKLWSSIPQKKGLPIFLIIFGIIPAALTRDPEHVLRSLLAIPGFMLLAAMGMTHLQHHHKPWAQWCITVLSIEIIAFMLLYFAWYPAAYARDWQYGYPQIASYLNTHANEYDKIVVTKWFGEPQLFLAFYAHWDPVWYQQQNQANLAYETDSKMWLDQLESYSLGKYTFKYINWQSEARDKKTLYIGKADDFYPDSNIKDTIKYPDGTIAFYIVEGDK